MKNKTDFIFEYAALAPSSHNAQMWRIVNENENRYRVEIDPHWTLKAVDPHNREAYISLGCFLQNCIYCAAHLAVTVKVTIADSKAYLTFSERNGEKISAQCNLYDIEKRHTCRLSYANKPIQDDIVELVLATFKNIRYVDRRTALAGKLSELIVNSNSMQFTSEKSMDELSHFIATDINDMQGGRGLTLKNLGLNATKRFFFRILYAKKNFARYKSFLSSSIRTTKKQVKHCSGYFVLFVHNQSPDELIKLGMKIEKLWILLNAKGLSVHPMSQPLEEMPDATAHLFPNSGAPQMILRVGYCRNNRSWPKLRKQIVFHSS